MNRQRRFVLLAAVALFFGLGCQIADLLADKPTPPPSSLPAVRTVVVPTTERVVAPTVSPVLPTATALIEPTASPSVPPASPTNPVAAPTQAQSPICTNPNAAITSLAMNGTVSGLIEIRGTAARPDMQYWKVEYRSETGTDYISLNNSDKAVTDGILARWSTKTVPNGTYFVRLVIVQKDGNFGTPCEIRIKIAN